MDSPLVLTSQLIPSEVDDQSHGLDVQWRYPLQLYEAALNYKDSKEVKIDQIKHRLGTPLQYEKFGFTHPLSNLNMGIKCSAYKTIPTMEEKVNGQLAIAMKLRSVDAADVARLIIEKHFIDKHTPQAFDDQFSLDKKEFTTMVDRIRWQETVIGKVKYGPQTSEEKVNLQFRRSLFVVKDITKGEKFTLTNIRSIRPGYGLAPKFLDQIIGKTATQKITAGTPLSRKLFK